MTKPTLRELLRRVEALEEERESRLDNLLVLWPDNKFTLLSTGEEVDINNYDSEKLVILPVRYESPPAKNPQALQPKKSIEKDIKHIEEVQKYEITPAHKQDKIDKTVRKNKPFRQLIENDENGIEISRTEF